MGLIPALVLAGEVVGFEGVWGFGRGAGQTGIPLVVVSSVEKVVLSYGYR